MKKQLLFIHSAGPQSEQQGSVDLIGYLANELQDRYEFITPHMPYPEDPNYGQWKEKLSKVIEELDGEVICIGHSLGGAVLLKYLSEETCPLTVTGLFNIAVPYWGLDNEWIYQDFELKGNYIERLPKIPEIYLYHSEFDPIVPYDHFLQYIKDFPQAKNRKLSGDSHLFQDGIPQLISDLKKL
ncbi:alpha/beta hydrolase [Ornithinibacillus salinisoli]|uniref:Alpha/beta hydrolase n=1 Tax=Ornithinibacillus salinisoli TaxID=1848459 RepID=A0ABW4W038_9BACI